MPCVLTFTCVPMGRSQPEDRPNSQAKLDVLVTPSCDDKAQVLDLVQWTDQVLKCADKFTFNQKASGQLQLLQNYLQPGLWDKLLGDAEVDQPAANSKPVATPIAPHGVSLTMTHDLAHQFYSSAYGGPIDPSNHAPKRDFLKTLHTQAANDHGLYVAEAVAAAGAAASEGDDKHAVAVLKSIDNAPEAHDADTLIRARFGVNAPRLNTTQSALVPTNVKASGGSVLQPPAKANRALAHLKFHLTNSLKAAGNVAYNPMPQNPRSGHLLYHVNRLVRSSSHRRSSGATKVAETIFTRKSYSFNKRITLLLNMPAILEALGLVLHFELPWKVASKFTTVQLDIPSELQSGTRQIVSRITCSNSNFLPKPRSNAITDNGWMNPADGYQSGSLQLDSAAMQITQFASQAGLRQASRPDSVTVSYDEDIDHPLLPPSPQTDGFQVWQDDLQGKVNDQRQTASSNAHDPTKPLYAEDLRNGVVVDVLATDLARPRDKQKWVRLCLRNEEFHIDRFRIERKRIERGVKIAAARSIDPGIAATLSHETDETIFTWRSGSLIAKSKLVTKRGIQSGTKMATAPRASQRLPWGNYGKPKLEEVEPCGTPLFGWKYDTTMRAQFVTGGAVPFDETTALKALLQAQQPFRRYELVDGPVLIPVKITDHYLENQSPTMMFVGSLVRDDLSISRFTELSQRVIVPAQTTPTVARRHGKSEDLIKQGATVFPLLDGSLPKEIVSPFAPAVPTSGTYLPDPLCTGVLAILTDLKGAVIAQQSLGFYNKDDASWPEYVPHIVQLEQSQDASPSLKVGTITSAPNAFPFLKQGLSKAFICRVPPGKTYLLALRPQLDPANLSNVHALSLVTQAGNTPAQLDVSKLVLSDMCRPTMVRLTHATDRPVAKPKVTMVPPLTSNSASVTDPKNVLVGATLDPWSTSKVALVANWDEMTDDVNQNSYTKKALEAQLWESSIAKKSDSGEIKVIKTQFPFSDTRYRRLVINARGTARYGDVFGKSDKQTRTLDSDPVTLDILATAAPKAPDVEYVLPNLRWELLREKRTRTMGLTVVLNRPWFSSGIGEQLAVVTAPCANENGPMVDNIGASFDPNEENKVSAWGVFNDWLPVLPKDAAKKGIQILMDATRIKDKDDAVPPPDTDNFSIVNIGGKDYWALLFAPRFNELDQQWFVNLALSSPPTYGAVVRLLTARYQKHAVQGANLSDVSMCDFALLRPDRAVNIISKWEGIKRKMRIQIVGLAPTLPDGVNGVVVPQTYIEVRHFETEPNKPHYFDWRAGDVVSVDPNFPTAGNVLWQATFDYPWQGGRLVAQEWEIWPAAEDTNKTAALPVYSDVIPLVWD
jgi:hypothetical protein